MEAAYRGDPAAKSHHEIIFCYPGLEAITTYRVAHELHAARGAVHPADDDRARPLARRASTSTPGRTIGPGFFIDHGTGVVIGETCDIGANVKLYQGVTLGALSFDRGRRPASWSTAPTSGTRRCEDEVVVYANATILGGQTVVGERAVIGSNVWLTKSVAPYTVVVLEKPQHKVKGPASRLAGTSLPRPC